MNRSEQIGELISALAKAQAEFTPALKENEAKIKGTTKSGGAYEYGYKYADLAANISAVRPALNKHGIVIMHFNGSDLERQVASVTCSLHLGEQFISETAEAPAVGQNGFSVQSLGAVWTYLRRYTLQALCGLATEDDDGASVATDHAPIPKKRAEVVADAQKRAEAMQQRTPEEGPFQLTGDILKCVIRGVNKKKTVGENGKEYVSVIWNGRLQGFNYATTFDSALFDPLMGAVNQECELKLKAWKDGDKFINITGVASINGQPVSEETTTAA